MTAKREHVKVEETVTRQIKSQWQVDFCFARD